MENEGQTWNILALDGRVKQQIGGEHFGLFWLGELSRSVMKFEKRCKSTSRIKDNCTFLLGL